MTQEIRDLLMQLEGALDIMASMEGQPITQGMRMCMIGFAERIDEMRAKVDEEGESHE